jgi:hypothetical protein
MKKKGLTNSIVINFRWNGKGKKLVAKRAEANGMSKEAYLRYCVELETRTLPYPEGDAA